jgi:fibronectin-binding autotransporter adhesin
MTAEPMKTRPNKITDRNARKLSSILAAVIPWLLPALILFVATESSFAADATWVGGQGGPDHVGDWNFREPTPVPGFPGPGPNFPGQTNWNPNTTIPNGSGDTATFATSSITDVFLSENTEVNGILFQQNASEYRITVGANSLGAGLTLHISGVGITNNSGITQHFVVSGAVIGIEFGHGQGSLVFGPTPTPAPIPGANRFGNSAIVGNVEITNMGGSGSGAPGGATFFTVNSNAGNANITNNGGTTTGALGGSTTFQDSSHAGNATITNNGATDTFLHARGGSTTFQDSSHADNATITNNGGTSDSAPSGFTTFQDSSHADNATLIANGGSNGGSGAFISFEGDSTGDTARVEVFGDGSLDIASHNGSLTVGSIEGDGDVGLGGNTLIVGSNNLSTTFSGVISDFDEEGVGSLTKVGTGTLTLTGANTYTGATSISAGILNIQNLTALGTTAAGTIVSSGATLQLQGGITVGTEALTISGTGATGATGALENVSETNNYGGLVTLGAASTISSDAGTLNLTNTGTITGAGFGLTLTGAGNGTISSIIGTGTGTLTKNGAGTWTLFGANTYTGATSINAGILNIQNPTALGTTAAGTTVSSGATLQLQGSVSVGAEDLTISGAGAAGQNGALVNVSGTNNYGGLITLAGDSTISSDVGTLNLTNTGIITGAGFGLTLTGAGNGTISSIIATGTGTLTKNAAGTWTLSGENTYTGATMVNGGTLRAGVANTLPSQTALSVATGATFDLNNFTQSIGSLAGAGSVTLGTATLTTGNDNTSTDFSGVISGLGGVTKVGTGTWTLSSTSTNTYTGPTTVDAGTLLVDGSLAGTAVTVNSGATLGGTGTAAGAVTIADGGILAPGNSRGTPGTFTVGSLSLSNASLLDYDLGTPGVIGLGVNDLTIVRGNLTLDGILNTTALAGFGPGGYRLFNYGGALTDNTLDIGTVPTGFLPSNFIVVTGVPNEVDLLVLAGPSPPPVQFWDGPHTTPNGVINGGTGNWDNFTTNWTDSSGNTNSSWQNGMAVFAGSFGIVTVTQPIFFTGMEFMTNGYQIDQGAEGSLNLIGSPVIDTAFDNVTATINATINGEGGITKTGPGTLILNAENTYTGITTINAGVLSISSDANLGTAPDAPVDNQLTFNGGTLQATASFALDTNRGITLLGGGTIGVTAANILTYGGVITGAGSLTKTDTGTLVLSGANTYNGATTVNGGTLRAGAINTLPSQTALTVATGATFDMNNFSQSIGSLAGAGSVTLGAATLTTGNDNTGTDFSGVISSTGGGLTKVGTGTQTLSGDNTYSGGTTISAGTLLVDGSLADASAVTVNSGATLGGIGTAAGAVTIADGGILAPGNSPGPGTLTVGSLSLGNASLLNYDLGTPGVIGLGVNDLTIVRGNLTLDGILNTTALAGFGPGAYRLFNYGGALTDNTLDIGTVPTGFLPSNFTVITGLPNEVDLLVLAGPLAPLVQFWDGPNIRSNGVIEGGTGNWDNFTTNWTDGAGNNNSSWRDGVAVFAGAAGTVTVTQPIFFAGLEFMTDGYQIDAATRGSLNLIGSPTIITDPNVTATINATLAGAGGITKEGVGTLILNAANTYLGNTAIDAGSLIVDGSIASAQTFVNAGGLLGGGGIIGGDLTNSGIVSPGHSSGSLGTLTVNGNYTQTANGTLRIEIAGTAPGQFDLLAVGGHASLAGTLQLIRLGNFQLQVGDTVTFLTAKGGVSGTFSTIQNPFISNTLIKAEINILANSVELEGTQGSFTEVACNPNTLAVAKALDSAVGDPRAAGLIEFLDTQPLDVICPELELISPEELAAMFNIGVSLANIQSVNLERRMEDIRAGSSGFSARGFSIDRRVPESGPGLAGPTGPEGKSGPPVMQPRPENRWGVFVTGLGEFTSVDDTSIAPGYDFSTGGLTFGVDYRVSPNFAIGLTGGYAHTNADLVNNGSLDVNGGTIGAYATGFAGGFYFDAAAFGVFNGYDSHRTALLGTASGNTDGQDFNALAVAGYDWKSGGLTIGPLASFQYTYVEFDSFTEHGSLAPLSFSNQNAHSTRTALGAKGSYDWHAGHVLIRPEIRASWQHEFGDRDYSVVSRFANGAGNSFTVNGPEIGRDSLLIGAGAAVIFNDRVSVYAYYDGELARTNYSSNNVSAGVRVSF